MAPTAKLEVAGVTAMEARVLPGGVTVIVDVPFTPLMVAVTVAVPAATAVAMPVALTVATEVLEEDHVTCEVTLAVVPLL